MGDRQHRHDGGTVRFALDGEDDDARPVFLSFFPPGLVLMTPEIGIGNNKTRLRVRDCFPVPTWHDPGDLLSGWDGYCRLKRVPCLSIACMMMARRRASAIRASRIVDRLPIANAQSLGFSGLLYRVIMTFAAYYVTSLGLLSLVK